MSDLAAVATWWRVTIRRRVGRGLSRQSEDVLIEAADRADLAAQLAGIKGAVDGYHQARIHECSVCGRSGPWTETWGWYGSVADLDNGNPVVKVCSPECFASAQASGLIPRTATTIDDVA